ncbi:MAG: SsrA-binding protein SmpB [Planctomycetota bacterium]|jgi:SsrA-binding protein
MAKGKKKKDSPDSIQIQNRKARHDYTILETLEVGIALHGSEVKSIRAGKASLQEGYVRVQGEPLGLFLHSIHVGEYQPAGSVNQHHPTRTRKLLAHKREIRKLLTQVEEKGVTIVPLKMYFRNGYAKLEIGVARGKSRVDKRQDLRKKEHARDIERAMTRKRLG